MEEKEETPPEEYIHGFNNGYQFSKLYTDAGKQMLNILKDKKINKVLTKTDGMIHGINQQQIEQEKEISIGGLNEIKDIRNQQGEEKEIGKEI